MEQNRNKEIFETMPVAAAVRTMALPTIISQLIVLIYNMADTFYLGRSITDPSGIQYLPVSGGACGHWRRRAHLKASRGV